MKKKNTIKKLQYQFDRIMTKGTIAMITMLFTVCLIALVIIGLISSLSKVEGGVFYHLWESLLHTLDPGTISGTSTDNKLYIIMMTVSTFFGLIFTSVLIGIISTGFEEKLAQLRKGKSVVQEENHTVIIGFNDNIYTILSELIEANSNHKNMCIVVLGEEDKVEMEDAISAHFPDTRTTHIICRSGSLHEAPSLERCSVETSRSVIINEYDDAEVLKIVLALTTYIKDKDLLNKDLHFTGVVQNEENLETVTLAGEGHSEIIFAKDAISRIIAHTCREHGLTEVLVELFDFDGDELYFEYEPSVIGKTFHETLNCFSNATVFGINRNDEVLLNPPMDTVLLEGDAVILMEDDDGSFALSNDTSYNEALIRDRDKSLSERDNNMLVLGFNDKITTILDEFDKYVACGTQVTIVAENIDTTMIGAYKNIVVTTLERHVTHKLLQELLDDSINNVLVLSKDDGNAQANDSRTLQLLIFLRHIADNYGYQFAITTEMLCSDNQRLATNARVDDFVIGSNLINLMMTQVAENRFIKPLIDVLLDDAGSELYMKPAVNYVKIGAQVDFRTVTESAARKGEIFVGYKNYVDGMPNIVTNPDKNESIVFDKNDLIIVVAED